MARTRLIRPGFFKDGDLYDAEQATGLPLRVAFAGLWTVADREGRFEWKPRELKHDVLPYDPVDFSAVLDALHDAGFLVRYINGGSDYGVIPNFKKHQTFHKKELASRLPPDTDPGSTLVEPRSSRRDAVAVTVAGTDTGANYSAAEPAPPAQSKNDVASLWPLIREKLWIPDGQPPSDWDEGREGSVLKQLLKHYSASQVAAAIEGLALLRDKPGKYADPVTWLTPGCKITLRAVHNSASGVRAMFGIATQAYWKSLEARGESKSKPAAIGAVLSRMAQ